MMQSFLGQSSLSENDPSSITASEVSDGKGKPRHDQALAWIEQQILNGQLHPGDRIKEKALAEALGMSRSPVREAFRVLQQAGVVEIIPNRGAFVRKASLRDVLHLFDIRGALWRLAAIEATENLTRRHMNYLESQIERMDLVIAAKDSDAYMELNTRFHEFINSVSGNRPLARIQRNLFLQGRLFRRGSLSTDEDLQQRNADHRLLLDAMKDGAGEEAGRISEDHVRQSKHRFLQSLGATMGSFGDVLDRDLATFDTTGRIG